VLDDEQRDALLLESTDEPEQVIALGRVHARRRLVEQEQPRRGHDGARDLQ